ncbi:MAG: hypothetical protein O3C40_22360 [Planctomycetota bacterium]|nr:hypothetical protein [Planctomycetota bacterium]
MKSCETDAKVGPQGVLTLQQLPFADGQAVHVRIEIKLESSGESPRVLGWHEGMVTISEDFDEPLPDSFWLGADANDEASA